MTWMMAHWLEVLLHMGIDMVGGLTLKCAMGMCEHKRHQNAIWMLFGMIISISTVALIG